MALSRNRIELNKLTMSLQGYDELIKQIVKLEKIPKIVLTKAAREGIKRPLEEAKKGANTPEDTGALRKGIIKVLEKKGKNRKKKSVFQLFFSKKMNPIFVKKIDNPGIYGGKRKTAYYPVSQEYGYKTKYGRENGKYFIERAVRKYNRDSLQRVTDVMLREINKRLK
jgi:hypothetical protein